MSNRPNRQAPSSAKVKAAAGTGGGSTPVWVWVVIGVGVLLAAVLAVALTSGGEGTVTTSSGEQVEAIVYGEPALQSEALPELPQGGADPAVGMLAPAIEGQDLAGEPTTIPGAGRPKIVMFLAHWCPHCQAEVPRVQEWLDESGMPSDVDLYAVATGTSSSRTNFPPGDWLREKGWSVPTLVDDEQSTAANAYGLLTYPYFVVVDSSGKVVTRASGEITQETWNGLLEAARTGVPLTGSVQGESSPSS